MHRFERFITARYAINLWPEDPNALLFGDFFPWLLRYGHQLHPGIENGEWDQDEALFGDAPGAGLDLVRGLFQQMSRPNRVSPIAVYCSGLQRRLCLRGAARAIVQLLIRASVTPAVQDLLIACQDRKNGKQTAIAVVSRAIQCSEQAIRQAQLEVPLIGRLLPFAERPPTDLLRQNYIRELTDKLAAINRRLLIGKFSERRYIAGDARRRLA